MDNNADVTNINGMTILYWNTERMYTPGGQRIVATPFSLGEDQDKDVLFLDLDRNIDGVIPNCPLFSYAIMKSYDKNTYHPIGNQDELSLLQRLMSVKEELLKLFEGKE